MIKTWGMNTTVLKVWPYKKKSCLKRRDPLGWFWRMGITSYQTVGEKEGGWILHVLSLMFTLNLKPSWSAITSGLFWNWLWLLGLKGKSCAKSSFPGRACVGPRIFQGENPGQCEGHGQDKEYRPGRKEWPEKATRSEWVTVSSGESTAYVELHCLAECC